MTAANIDSKKNTDSFEYSDIVRVYQRKVYHDVNWLTKRFWKNHFMHFWEDVGKTVVMKVVKNDQKMCQV